jgi:hypothetical protein
MRPFLLKGVLVKESDIRITKHRPGWLLPYLLGLDDMFNGRWEYWMSAVFWGNVPMSQIPKIQFQAATSFPGKEVRKNLDKCIGYAENSMSNALEKFIDWILWGLNYRKIDFPDIDDKTDDYWYRTFNLGLFYKEPADHFADLAADYQVGKGAGFFATPSAVVELMSRVTFGGEPKHEHKTKSVMDPCCGTGGMLLHASNYSLNLYGNDIHPLLCKMAILNGYIYVPWLVYRPKHLKMFDVEENEVRCTSNSIISVKHPSGIKTCRCTSCGNDKNFVLDVQTKCIIKSDGNGGHVMSFPDVSADVSADVANINLKPENITCALCLNKSEKEYENFM